MVEVSIEAVPVAAGVVIGLAARRLVPRPLRTAFVLGVSPLIALLITFLSGEFEVSWAFAVFDVGQLLLAALLTVAVASGLRARSRAHA